MKLLCSLTGPTVVLYFPNNSIADVSVLLLNTKYGDMAVYACAYGCCGQSTVNVHVWYTYV